MKALSDMYEKPSANNKMHLMKKLFNLKMAENTLVAQYLNEFNTITNQLLSVEIDFDDEIHALIILASLPNSWEAMRMIVSNSIRKEKLKYNDIRDLILAEEIRRRDASKTSRFGSALNLETKAEVITEIQIETDQNPKILIRTKVNLYQPNEWYQSPWWCGVKVARLSIFFLQLE